MNHKNFRRRLIAFVTFCGGLYFFLEFLLPKKVFGVEVGYYHDEITNGVILVGAMAIGLGIINLLRVHGGNILKSRPGWSNSLALLLGMFVVFAIEVSDFLKSEESGREMQRVSNLLIYTQSKVLPENRETLDILANSLMALKNEAVERRLTYADDRGTAFLGPLDKSLSKVADLKEISEADFESSKSELVSNLREFAAAARDVATSKYESTASKKASRFVFNAFFVPLGSAMFSLLAFYVATAAYRSFRVQSFESTIMMLAAVVVMLGQIPHGPLYISENLPQIRLWLLKNISTPAFRAIFFGSAVAGLAMAVRMWLSLEKSPLSSENEGQG